MQHVADDRSRGPLSPAADARPGRAGRTRRSVLGRTAATGAMIIGAAALPLLTALPAEAAPAASAVAVDAGVAKDGTVTAKETITFDGTAPDTLSQRFENRENLLGDRRYVQTVSGVTATSGSKQLTVRTDDTAQYSTITVDTAGVSGPVVISYTTVGAVISTADGPTLHWRALQGLSVPASNVTANVRIPTTPTFVRCTAGAPNSTVPCDTAAGGTEDSQTPTFGETTLGQGQVLAVEIGFPTNAVSVNEKITYRWTVARAFSVKPLPLGLALGLLVLGGLALVLLHRRAGRDASARGDVVRAGEFAPVGAGESEFRVLSDIRPGHVGTVVDERVDPIDITASLLDLAVRGHLLITELPRESEYGRTDWLLRRLDGPDDLRPFESTLLDATVARGDEVRVSEIGSRVHGSVGAVQDALYDEVVANGWYERRPDATRSRWTTWGIAAIVAAVVVTVLLAAFTTFGLTGIVLIVLALGLVFVGQEMPARTARGAALLAGLGALRSDLLTHPTNQMPKGRELRELSEVLPYAVVLGGAERWLDAIVAADDDADADPEDLSWYHGPDTWHLRHLPESLRNFVTTVTGSLFSR